MFFERIYFSRGSDAEIYQERKTWEIILPAVLKLDEDTDNTVFSYILILQKLLSEW
jgi:amidophosphoribosyltransferase